MANKGSETNDCTRYAALFQLLSEVLSCTFQRPTGSAAVRIGSFNQRLGGMSTRMLKVGFTS